MILRGGGALFRPVWVSLVIVLCWVVGPAAVADQQTMVRVAILQGAEQARLTVQAPCRLTDLRKGTVLAQWPQLKWQEAAATESGIRIGQSRFGSTAVVLEPANPNAAIGVDARPYRGRLILRRTEAGKLLVIDWLPLEEYLVGALASETSSRWPMEALRAHAVVSRTMVAHRIWIRRDQPFDVTADVSTHLYYGTAAEKAATRQAVQQTRGQVLTYQGELFSASFHANCGGHTENAAELWSMKEPVPPLEGVPDAYCKGLKHFRWDTEVGKEEWDRALGPVSGEVGDLEEAEVLERNRSGRVRALRLKGSRGAATVTGRQLREMLGANRLRSLNFNIAVLPGNVRLTGFGWGHGVGMCQWGAYGMARSGKKMEEILAAYFPGAERRNLSNTKGFSS